VRSDHLFGVPEVEMAREVAEWIMAKDLKLLRPLLKPRLIEKIINLRYRYVYRCLQTF
jgi:hypothetical protein